MTPARAPLHPLGEVEGLWLLVTQLGTTLTYLSMPHQAGRATLPGSHQEQKWEQKEGDPHRPKGMRREMRWGYRKDEIHGGRPCLLRSTSYMPRCSHVAEHMLGKPSPGPTHRHSSQVLHASLPQPPSVSLIPLIILPCYLQPPRNSPDTPFS